MAEVGRFGGKEGHDGGRNYGALVGCKQDLLCLSFLPLMTDGHIPYATGTRTSPLFASLPVCCNAPSRMRRHEAAFFFSLPNFVCCTASSRRPPRFLMLRRSRSNMPQSHDFPRLLDLTIACLNLQADTHSSCCNGTYQIDRL